MIALVLGLFAVISAPGLAVSHGAAHRHLAVDAAHAHVEDATIAALDAGHPHEHAHPEISVAVASRADLQAAILPVPMVVPPCVVVCVVDAVHDATIAIAHGPPPENHRQPRAPPLG